MVGGTFKQKLPRAAWVVLGAATIAVGFTVFIFSTPSISHAGSMNTLEDSPLPSKNAEGEVSGLTTTDDVFAGGAGIASMSTNTIGYSETSTAAPQVNEITCYYSGAISIPRPFQRFPVSARFTADQDFDDVYVKFEVRHPIRGVSETNESERVDMEAGEEEEFSARFASGYPGEGWVVTCTVMIDIRFGRDEPLGTAVDSEPFSIGDFRDIDPPVELKNGWVNICDPYSDGQLENVAEEIEVGQQVSIGFGAYAMDGSGITNKYYYEVDLYRDGERIEGYSQAENETLILVHNRAFIPQEAGLYTLDCSLYSEHRYDYDPIKEFVSHLPICFKNPFTASICATAFISVDLVLASADSAELRWIETSTFCVGIEQDCQLPTTPTTPTTPTESAGCLQSLGTLTEAITRTGEWTAGCESEVTGRGYARYYGITVEQGSQVTIDLESSEDTYLYLRRGEARSGTALHENDDVASGNTDSQISETLSAGSYTIEATTYSAGAAGSFTLTVSGLGGGTTTEPGTGTDHNGQLRGQASAVTGPAVGHGRRTASRR